MSSDLLAGVSVLDFGTVGPAARASAILADYGATITKVGAVPRSGAVTITPLRLPTRVDAAPAGCSWT